MTDIVTVAGVPGTIWDWTNVPGTWADDALSWAQQETTTWTVDVASGWATAEALVRVGAKNIAEAWHTLDVAAKTAVLRLAETWRTAESFSQAFAGFLHFNEAWTTNESIVKTTSKVVSETWHFTEVLTKLVGKQVAVALTMSESFAKVSAFSRNFAEITHFLEVVSKSGSKGLADGWNTTDAAERQFTKSIAETLHTVDVLTRAITYSRAINEGFSVAAAISKAVSLTPQEIFHLVDQFLRRGHAVFSDLKIGNTPLTDVQFNQELIFGGPAGFADWKPFVAGDYQFEKAAIRYIVQSLTSDRPRITAMKVTVDVPDIHDRGTASIAAGPGYTFVPFNRAFTSTAAMEVTCTLKGGTVVAVPRIKDPSGLTTTGFFVRLEDVAGGTFPAGTISWTAIGY